MELCDILFYLFAGLALLPSVLVVALRTPVSSAKCMAISFAMTAAVLFGLGAHFLGIIQILVYAGAIMVLFLFIIMLLNVKKEEKSRQGWFICCVASCVAAAFAGLGPSWGLNVPRGGAGAAGGAAGRNILFAVKRDRAVAAAAGSD